jgi:hypothetical protein
MARGPDPSLLATSLFIQQFLVFHAVVDGFQDRFEGQIVFSGDLFWLQWFLPDGFAVEHFGADTAVYKELAVVGAASFRL